LCVGFAVGKEAFPTTTTVTQVEARTSVETVTVNNPPDSGTVSRYAAGYPRVVPISEVPDEMVDYSGAADGADSAIAVAPGVWVKDAPGTTVLEDAESGSLFGWCASVEAFQSDHPDHLSGATCW
jgi:hypothetical protein